MALYQRLKDLREDADMTQTEIAKILGTTAQYYGRYEKGECELPLYRAVQLAEFYNVSLNYLAGLNNIKFETPLECDEEQLLNNWRSLSERNKGKIEYHIEELLKTQDDNRH